MHWPDIPQSGRELKMKTEFRFACVVGILVLPCMHYGDY